MMDINCYSKIILVGSGGSGKSWLSKRLAEITGYPLFHLDKEFWRPGWEMTPKEERIARQNEITSGDKWIIDGNYNSTMEMRYAAADLVIFLDISRVTCAISAIRRRGTKRSDLPEYLVEGRVLSKDYLEFLKWIWSYPRTGRKTVMALREKYPDIAFLRIRSRREVGRWVEGWEGGRR